jgi:phosphatidylserine decarboxylase
MSGPTVYRNRETGALQEERIFGGNALPRIYETLHGRVLLESLLKRAPFNHLYGALQRSPRSRGKIERFVRELGIDASEAELPLSAYRSLDDFFTRRLKPGARPVDAGPEHLVTPGDGRLLAFEAVDVLRVKGSQVSLDVLLGDAALAARFRGGAVFVLRLAPADYHRFHFPDSGIASPSRELPGPLHSVHPIALGAGAPSFANKRAVSLLASPVFGDLAIVEVGALCVGTIVQTYAPGHVARGQEKGTFRFGGSTIVLLALPGAVRPDADLLESTSGGVETFVKMGTRIGRRP